MLQHDHELFRANKEECRVIDSRFVVHLKSPNLKSDLITHDFMQPFGPSFTLSRNFSLESTEGRLVTSYILSAKSSPDTEA